MSLPWRSGLQTICQMSKSWATLQLNSDLYALGILIIHLMTGVSPTQLSTRSQFRGNWIGSVICLRQAIEPGLIAHFESDGAELISAIATSKQKRC